MKTWLPAVWVIFSKEVQDNLRDRRSVTSALLSSLIGPGMLLLLIVLMGKTLFQEFQERGVVIPISGAQNAPSLVQFLNQNGAQVIAVAEEPSQLVQNRRFDMVLVIPDTYGERFTSGRPAGVRLLSDSSRQSARISVELTRQLLNAYNQQIGNMRLLARGINPTVVQPLSIESVDLAPPQSQGFLFLNMMPYFIILVVFLGGMYVVIDTTAGERERKSLEPLLINPVPRWQFVVGKVSAALPFAASSVAITLAAFWYVFNIFPIEDYLGIQVSLKQEALVGVFLISLPMVVLATALQMIIATFTRSFKEAQTYVAFLPLIPALPGIALAFLPTQASLWAMLIPTFGQQMLINQLIRGEALNPLHVILSTVVTLLLSAGLTRTAIQLFQHERVVLSPD